MLAWWCNGEGVDLRLERSRVQLPEVLLSGNKLGEVVHTHTSVTKQKNLLPVTKQQCPTTGKVIVGLASHQPCVADLCGLSTYGLKA